MNDLKNGVSNQYSRTSAFPYLSSAMKQSEMLVQVVNFCKKTKKFLSEHKERLLNAAGQTWRGRMTVKITLSSDGLTVGTLLKNKIFFFFKKNMLI